MRNPMDNFEENIDEIILAHCEENFLCVCRVFRGVRIVVYLPFFLQRAK